MKKHKRQYKPPTVTVWIACCRHQPTRKLLFFKGKILAQVTFDLGQARRFETREDAEAAISNLFTKHPGAHHAEWMVHQTELPKRSGIYRPRGRNK